MFPIEYGGFFSPIMTGNPRGHVLGGIYIYLICYRNSNIKTDNVGTQVPAQHDLNYRTTGKEVRLA